MPEGRPRTTRLLIVDDEADIAHALRLFLEGAKPDWKVVTASSGAEAMTRLKQERFDVILSDFKMPGMTGLEFLKGAQQVAGRTPRIMFTAFPDMDLALRALEEAHIAHFLTKPLDPLKLVQVVQTVLDESISEEQRRQKLRQALPERPPARRP